MEFETLPSACCIIFNESSIPFYYTSNGYKNKTKEIKLLYDLMYFSKQRFSSLGSLQKEENKSFKKLVNATVKEGCLVCKMAGHAIWP